ncbi:MAG TPA: putative Ig domain-containing protein, partial [Spirochaetota bacterium]|nr:putative Ig domain-containing protein [Spirochaetota bacterium]
LPNGLTLNSSTGVISGTPDTEQAAISYIITAENSGGSTTATISITVNLEAPTALTYSTTSAVYTRDAVITNNVPTVTGTVTNWSVAPALPNGLTLNSSTGVISGTPDTEQAVISYIITAENSGGSTTATISITVNLAAPTALSYSTPTAVYTRDAVISNNVPTVTGTVTNWSVSPALPSGLTLNTTTGVISGTPDTEQTAANYTITAENSGGSTTAVISITVNLAAPTALTYSTPTAVYTRDAVISNNVPTVTGTVTNWSVSPALPSGLTLNTTTGVISGTPDTEQTAANYTITAENSGGSTTAVISITVNLAAPTALTYSTPSALYTRNAVITNNVPTVTGTVTNWSVSPALPAGLTLNTTTGVISGTPGIELTATNFTITAANSGGSTTAVISITVTGVTLLRITPADRAVSPGSTLTYTATATMYDSSQIDVTASATWNITGSCAALTATPGEVSAVSTGTATISVSYQSVSSADSGNDANLTVTGDYFVSTTGNDLNTGTSASPFATIGQALSVAAAGSNIRIAEGNYPITSPISLTVDGVSLLGGYAADWGRDLINKRAQITDTATTDTGSIAAAIVCSAAITSATVIEGLDIYGSTAYLGNTTAAISTSGNPTIRYCSLDGGLGAASSYGLYSTAASATTVIENSEIDGGAGASSSYGIYATGILLLRSSNVNGGTGGDSSYGIYPYAAGNSIYEYSDINGGTGNYSYGIYQPSVASSSLVIRSCIIDGGTGATRNIGITFQNNAEPSPKVYNSIIIVGSGAGTTNITGITMGQASCPLIANNTFVLGNALTNARGVSTAYSAQPYIYNNIMLFSAGTSRCGIYEQYADADPEEVRNNLIYNATALYHDYDTTTDWTTVSAMETALGGTIASGNILSDPLFVGGADYHLQAGSPAIGSGLNGIDEGWSGFPVNAGTIPIDIEYTVRPQAGGGNWSIGAYE